MRIAIVGAGAIGGYLGVALSAVGEEVVLIGRRLLDEPSAMRIVEPSGAERAAGPTLWATRDLHAVAGSDVCFVAVKAQDTALVAAQLASEAPATLPVVSFQNGLRNLERLRRELPCPVVGAVVGFNVVREGPVRRRTSKGKLQMGEGGPRIRQLRGSLRRAGIRARVTSDIEGAIAGKLLVNLGNGVAAACGLATAALIESQDARWCFARCIEEGMAVMRAAGLAPKSAVGVPPSWMARGLRLSDALVAPLVRAIRPVDPAARSSTLQDLDRGKKTEIDELNGSIVWLAERSGGRAPVNGLVTAIVHEHERAIDRGERPHFVEPSELRRRIEALGEG